MIGNLKYCAIARQSAWIGGGEFSPAECAEAAHQLECVPHLVEALRALLSEADALTIAHGGIPTVSDRWPAAKQARRAIARVNGV